MSYNNLENSDFEESPLQRSFHPLALALVDPTSYERKYQTLHIIERKDQLEAIGNFFETGKQEQSVPHHTGNGMFEVIFDHMPRFSYTKKYKDREKKKDVFVDVEVELVMNNDIRKREERNFLPSYSFLFKDPTVDDSFHPVVRKDQLEAIEKFLTTGKQVQIVPHYTGDGTFKVTFHDRPKFSYTKIFRDKAGNKKEGGKVTIEIERPEYIAYMRRLINDFSAGGSRRHLKRSARSKKSRRRQHKTRRHRK